MNRRHLLYNFGILSLAPFVVDKKISNYDIFVNFCKDCDVALSNDDKEYFSANIESILTSDIDVDYPHKYVVLLWKALFHKKSARIFVMNGDTINTLRLLFNSYNINKNYFVSMVYSDRSCVINFYKQTSELETLGKIEFVFI